MIVYAFYSSNSSDHRKTHLVMEDEIDSFCKAAARWPHLLFTGSASPMEVVTEDEILCRRCWRIYGRRQGAAEEV